MTLDFSTSFFWIQVLMFSVIIPLIIYALFRPRIDLFFKYLLFLLLLYGLTEIISSVSMNYFDSNLEVYFISGVLECFLLMLIWYHQPSYSNIFKNITLIIGIVIAISVILLGFLFELSDIISIVLLQTIFLFFVYSIQYFINVIRIPTEKFLLEDPYLIVATGFLVYALSTSTIFAALELIPDEKNLRFQIYLLRQVFFLVFNIIIAYSIYTLARQQHKIK